MKIAVLGWYGHNNAGDERIKLCLEQFLLEQDSVKCVDFYDLHDHGIKGKTSRFDHYDLVIIGGGGIILSQCNYHDFINNIKTKIITLGISVEHPKLTGNAKKFAIALLNKSLVVIVRDRGSLDKLSPYDHDKKVKISSDLTFLKPYERINFIKEHKIAINLLPKPIDIKYHTLSNTAVSFFLRQLHRFGFDNIIRIVDFKGLIQNLKREFSLVPVPLYCASQEANVSWYQKNDIEFLKLYFREVPSYFSDKIIDECSLFLSMRLHGAIFAVQKGVPVISFSYLPKNRNFMKEVGLEEFIIETTETKKILTSIEAVFSKQDYIRDKMHSYTENATAQIRQDVIEALNLIG